MQGSGSNLSRKALLPSFARFLFENHLDEYVREGIRISYAAKLPIMKYFSSLSEQELYNLSIQGTQQVLQGLADGKPGEMLRQSLELWRSNQLPWMEKDDVVTEDITLLSHVRKKTMALFVTRFTRDPAEIVARMEEIDDWQLEYTSESFKTFVQILRERIDSQMNQLRVSDSLFRQAQAVTHIGNYVWDLDPPNLVWSDELYRIYGLNPQSTTITYEIAASYNHPDDREYIIDQIQTSRETLKPFDFYYRIVLDGNIKTLHARGEILVDEDDRPIKIFGTAQDVTQQKDIERKLEENRAFINKIADAAPAIIASYNVHTGAFVYVSEGLRKVLGYDPEHSRQQGLPFFTSLIHPDDLEGLLERNTAAQLDANQNGHANHEAVVEFVYRMRHANGTYRWFHTFGTVFGRDRAGKVELILNISLDINEKVKAEERLLRRTTELQQSNANLQEFAFVASHDLKEPLRKISTLGDRLVQTERDNYTDNGKVYLDKMISSALRMQQMVDDLLSLSQISSITLFEPTDLNQLLSEVLQNFETRIEALGATIQVNALPTAPVVRSQFRQLFQNLISNSLKFARNDVAPLIVVEWDRLPGTEFRSRGLRAASSYVRITFTDNGIGFDNRFSEKIFAIFQRLHTRSEYEGTGIGLAIVKKIIENHGGVIQAEGSLGEGATFTIIIPAD